MSSFCHLIIISSKYVLKSVGRRDQPWHTLLLISTSLHSLELQFINILLCVCICPLLTLIMYVQYLQILKYQVQSVFVYYYLLFHNPQTSVFPNYITFIFQSIISGKMLALYTNVPFRIHFVFLQ